MVWKYAIRGEIARKRWPAMIGEKVDGRGENSSVGYLNVWEVRPFRSDSDIAKAETPGAVCLLGLEVSQWDRAFQVRGPVGFRKRRVRVCRLCSAIQLRLSSEG